MLLALRETIIARRTVFVELISVHVTLKIARNGLELLQIQKAKGKIDDADFERMGFQKDKYFDGTEFERKSNYAPRMRAMDLSHSW